MPRYPVRPLEDALSANGGVAAVDRALTLAMAFRDGDQALSLRELCDRTHLVPSTASRLLASLQHFAMVQKLPDGRYALGTAIARMHRIYVASFNLETIVMPMLRRMVQDTRESASFNVPQGDQRLVLYRISSPLPLSDQSRAGDTAPMDRGAGGHVLSAFSGGRRALHDRIRRQGYVAMPVSDRLPELGGISAPVFGADGKIAGAVTLTMPAQRYQPAHIATVCAAAAELTQLLGGVWVFGEVELPPK